MGNTESHIKVQGHAIAGFHDHKKDLIVVVAKNSIQYYAPASNQEKERPMLKTVFTHKKSTVHCATFIEDEDLIITADEDFRIRLYKASTGDYIKTIPGEGKDAHLVKQSHSATIGSLLVLPFDRLLSGSKDGTVRLWNLKSGELVAVFAPPSPADAHLPGVTALAYDPKRNLLFAACIDGVSKAFDLDTGRMLIQYKGHGKGTVLALAVANTAELLASSSMDGTIRLWDIDNGKELGGYKYFAQCLAYDKLRDVLFCGNDNGFFSVMQVLNAGPQKAEMRKIKTVEFHRASVFGIYYNRYSDTLVTTASDNTVGYVLRVTEVPYELALKNVSVQPPKEEVTELPKEEIPEDQIEGLMEELKSVVAEDATSDISQHLQIEEKMLNLCLQLFDDRDEQSKLRRDRLQDSFNQAKAGLTKTLDESQRQMTSQKRELWDDKWPVIDPRAGLNELEESHKQRKSEMAERHKQEEQLLKEQCERELQEFQTQLPGERKKVAKRYSNAKQKFQVALSTSHNTTLNTLRGLLGSAFPIIRNRYQIGSLISVNSTSVFKGIDLQNMDLVAIKVFPLGVSLTTTLDHPTLVPIIDVCTTSNSIYVVMQIIKDRLSSYVRGLPEMLVTVAKAQEIIQTLLQSLAYLHQQSLVVRDLRPSGVLLDYSKHSPRLTHLGVMRALLGTAECEPPEDGMVYGAPEIFGRVVNTASDIWSLGCILLYLLQTKEERSIPLFYGSDPKSILETMVKVVGKPNLPELIEMASACSMAEDGLELLKFVGNLSVDSNVSAYSKLSQVCHRADANAIDLMVKMLKFEPLKRLTAKEALTHPFFNQQQQNLPINDHPSEFDQVKEEADQLQPATQFLDQDGSVHTS